MSDAELIKKCLDLAKQGEGKVSPNPMVGAILVKNTKVIASTYHSEFGSAHAEAKLIKQAGVKCKDAVLYVNLEPCCHQGKTPPCTTSIIEAGIKKVVIGSLDPNPLVAGKGVEILKAAGIEVTSNVAEAECRYLNRRFFKSMEQKTPYVTLKVAQTQDGFIAKQNGDSKWITGEKSRQYGHRMRAEHDAILVGVNTIIQDNPQLTLHKEAGRQPWRIVLDRHNRIPQTSNVLNDDFKDKTLVYSQSIQEVLEDLYKKEISSVLIEGGAQIYASFLETGLVDEIVSFTAPVKFEKGIAAFKDHSFWQDFEEVEEVKFEEDVMRRYLKK